MSALGFKLIIKPFTIFPILAESNFGSNKNIGISGSCGGWAAGFGWLLKTKLIASVTFCTYSVFTCSVSDDQTFFSVGKLLTINSAMATIYDCTFVTVSVGIFAIESKIFPLYLAPKKFMCESKLIKLACGFWPLA